MNAYLNLLGRDGNLTLVGMTERPFLMPALHIRGHLFDQLLSISAEPVEKPLNLDFPIL
jgi:hypothetical protein